MRILLLTDHFYPDLSSGGRLLTDLALGLVQSGDQVQVLTAFSTYNTTESGLPKEDYLGIKIERMGFKGSSRFNLISRTINEIAFCFAVFFRVLFHQKPDIILTLSSPPFLPFFVKILSTIKQISYVYVVMDVFPDIAVNMGLLKPDTSIVKVWEQSNKIALKNASRIVVLGRCMYDLIDKKLAPDRVPIDIIHNWSNAELIKPVSKDTNPFFIRYPELKEKFVVQYSGNLGRFQDFETILDAAERIQTHPFIHFLIIGEGFQRQWLIDEVERRGLNNVTLLPFQQDLIHSLNAADVALVTLKRGAEGLGVPSKVYPVLAAGKPVVAIMGEWAEVALMVKEFDIGIVLEQGDTDGLVKALQQWSSNPEELDSLGKRSREVFLQKFDRPHAIQAYQKCLRLAVGLDR